MARTIAAARKATGRLRRRTGTGYGYAGKPTATTGDAAYRHSFGYSLFNFLTWCQKWGVRPVFGSTSLWATPSASTDDYARAIDGALQMLDGARGRFVYWKASEWDTNGEANETPYYASTGIRLDSRREPCASVLERHVTNDTDRPSALHFVGGSFNFATGAPATQTYHAGNRGTYDSDYHYSAADSTLSPLYIARQNPNWLLNIDYRWERVQPTLGAALDATEVGRLQSVISNCAAAGLRTTLMMFNYAAYYATTARTWIGESTTCTIEHYQDHWRRMALAFPRSSYPSLWGWNLMDEPGDGAALSGGCRRTTLIDSFDSSIAGWASEEVTTGLAQDTSLKLFGAGSLKFTRDFGGAGYGQVRIGRSYAPGSGTFNFRAWVYLPASAGGTDGDWKASFYGYDNGGDQQPPAGRRYVTLYKGQWTLVTGQLALTTGNTVGLQLFCNSGGGSVQINLDDVYTGAASRSYHWEQLAQAGVNALRGAGDTRRINCPAWGEFASTSSPLGDATNQVWHPDGPWLVDSANNLEYELHYFPDYNKAGGSYDYDAQVTAAAAGGW